MTPAALIEQAVALIERRTSWRSPQFWATAAALVGAAVGVSWPGLAGPVKDALAAGGALVVAVFTHGSHQVATTLARTAPDLPAPTVTAAVPPTGGPTGAVAAPAPVAGTAAPAPADPPGPGGATAPVEPPVNHTPPAAGATP